jgi:hypothetical protein
MRLQRCLLLHWVFCAWGILYLLDGCAWLPSRYEVSNAGSPPSMAPPAAQDAGGHLSAQHSENLLEHTAGDPVSAAHLRQFVDAEQHLSIRADIYERVKAIIEIEETYPLIDETFREGWEAPGMADYDRYDEWKRP